MFVIKERGPNPPRELIEMLKTVEPATMGHFKHYGFIDPSIRPVLNDVKMVGPAVTVRTPGADSTIGHKVMDLVEPGDVIVIDRCGDTIHACWGGMVTLADHLKGVAGAIVDGPATDINEIIEIEFPLYSKGVTAITTKFLGIGGEINTVIHCGGVTVHPGDLIVADTDGIVVLRPDEAQKVAEMAIAMQEREKLKQGQSLPEITGANVIIAKKMNESS